MQITCSICSDLLVEKDTVVATSCGHLFHHQCLIKWLERSKSCPQCRAKSNEKSLNRIFFNVNHNGNMEDTNTLQNKLDSAEFKLLLSNNEKKKLKEEMETYQKKAELLKDEVKRLKHEVQSSETNVNTLREQFHILKRRNKELEPVLQEVENLRKQIEFFKKIETVVKGTSEEVDDLLNEFGSFDSINSLLTFTSVLKKEMEMTTSKKKELSNKLHEAESKVFSLTVQLRRLKDEMVAQRKESDQQQEELRHMSEECASLQKKVRSMEEAMMSPTTSHPCAGALKRLLAESPAPDTLKKGCLDTPEEEKKSSESPYLHIKSSVVGLTPLRPCSSGNYRNLNKFSIFKKPRVNTLTQRFQQPEEEMYDGLGGHSKPDLFPRPLPLTKTKKMGPRIQPISKIKLKDASSSLKMDMFLNK